MRGRRVMLDVDLAAVYGVAPKRLNEQVRRNRGRFPDDFAFQLTLDEARVVLASRSQIATLKRGQNLKYAPYVFTEHGAVMLAAVLNSPIAIDASIQVVRALRAPARDGGDARGAGAQARRARAQVRPAVQRRLRRDSSIDDTPAIVGVAIGFRSPTRGHAGRRG